MNRKSILLVEDEPDIRESLKEILEDEGYQVFEARNGREALALLEKIDRPFVIILDILMPVMNGQEFYEALQATPFADIPVIITTSDPSRAPSGLPLLRKPLSLGRLLDTVSDAFEAA